MKRIILILAALILLLIGCAPSAPPPTAQPTFDFIFRYGVGAKNELDTFEGTYTKDMVLDPSVTIKLSLTEEEMNQIQQKMTEISFFDYPEVFSVAVPPGEPVGSITPFASYYFKVQQGSITKELKWDAEIVNKDAKADKLKELIKLITDIIQSKPEYQKLPPPNGGYL